MAPDALKIQHGRFQHFAPADHNHFSFFPYPQLKEYETRELAQGRAPFFITATYEGKKRPVYFAWSLDLRGGDVPTAPAEKWAQAVHVSSDRYIDFWVDRYVRKILWHGRPPLPTWWVGLDGCAFVWDLYGVIDDHGHFISGVPWDFPFPRNSDEYLTSIKEFFHKLKQVAPEIKTMCNIGSLKDPNQFQSVYTDVPGIMAEDISQLNPKEFARKGQYNEFMWISWFGGLGRVAVLRAIVQSGDAVQLRTAYLIYLVMKGPNFFLGPEYQGSQYIIPSDEYTKIRSALGEPTAAMRIEPDRIKGNPYNVYSRTYERGIVYVNWTGAPRSINLPTGHHYIDANGQSVRDITVADLTGTYVTIATP